MSTTPTLTAPGIILRPLALTDAPALFVALSDPDVQRFRRGAPHGSVGETTAYIEDTLLRSRCAWAITVDGIEALGRLALRVAADEGEFGIVIRARAQRLGLGRRALALAEHHAFDDLHLDLLRADIDVENVASRGLFARAGYLEVATIVGHRTIGGVARDSVIVEKARRFVLEKRGGDG